MFKQYATYVTTVVDNFQQCPAEESYITEQYDLMSGRIASGKNEVMVVLDKDSELTDIVLAQLGYYSQDEFMNLIYRGAKETDPSMADLYDPSLDKDRFSYEEILGKGFTYYPNDDVFNVEARRHNLQSPRGRMGGRTGAYRRRHTSAQGNYFLRLHDQRLLLYAGSDRIYH